MHEPKFYKFTNNCVNVALLGLVPYEQGLSIQEKFFRLREEQKIGDIMLLLEHPPVITVGRRGKESNILLSQEELIARGIRVYHIDRGGLEYFKWINPCGITDQSMTSLENITGHKHDITKVMLQVASYFAKIFQTNYQIIDKHEWSSWLKED
ncbi:lipoyl protein ligase domain-containing protein [Caldicoprobacter algeriensis]|uniref:lipoyl protein ligase domain-containing protein n=1 Tax=Caldicoprobacter algeriensis TaxID=699281 RepID=UPI003B847890